MLIALTCALPLALLAPAAAWCHGRFALAGNRYHRAVSLFAHQLRSVAAGLLFTIGFYSC